VGVAKVKRSEFTYGQLDRVLRSLGFSFRLHDDDPPPTRVYQHAKAGATILLPAYPDSDRVLEVHIIDVRTQLDNFGIADPTVFAAKLQKAG
jgi:hypothetical protein